MSSQPPKNSQSNKQHHQKKEKLRKKMEHKKDRKKSKGVRNVEKKKAKYIRHLEREGKTEIDIIMERIIKKLLKYNEETKTDIPGLFEMLDEECEIDISELEDEYIKHKLYKLLKLLRVNNNTKNKMVFKKNLGKIEYSLKEKIVNIINMLTGERSENDDDDDDDDVEKDENLHNAGSNSSDSDLEENVEQGKGNVKDDIGIVEEAKEKTNPEEKIGNISQQRPRSFLNSSLDLKHSTEDVEIGPKWDGLQSGEQKTLAGDEAEEFMENLMNKNKSGDNKKVEEKVQSGRKEKGRIYYGAELPKEARTESMYVYVYYI